MKIYDKNSVTSSDRFLGIMLIIPVVIVIFGIIGIPLVQAVYLSFTDKVVGKSPKFIGIGNYISIWKDPDYWRVLLNTVIYTVGNVWFKLVFGMILALVLNQNFPGRTLARTVLLLPWALPGMVAAMNWRWMYDSTYGILNSMLLSSGLRELPIQWLSSPDIALISVMIVNIWRGVPFFLFSLLGGLQTIDGQMYEAAMIDGAGPVRQFFSITVPSINTIIKIAVILSTIWTFNDFENIYLVTGGGPLRASSVISTFTYDVSFIQNELGRSLAVATSIIPILALVLIYSGKALNAERD